MPGGEISDEWTDRPADHPLFLNPEPAPQRGPVGFLEGQTCRGEIVDDLDDLGLAHAKSEMMRDRSRGDHGIVAVTVAKQGKRSGRRNIVRDPGAAARHELRCGSYVVG